MHTAINITQPMESQITHALIGKIKNINLSNSTSKRQTHSTNNIHSINTSTQTQRHNGVACPQVQPCAEGKPIVHKTAAIRNGNSSNETTNDNNEGFMEFKANKIIGGKYKMIKQLGQGTFSTVFECRTGETTQNTYAIKVMRDTSRYHLAAFNELNILKQICLKDPRQKSYCIHIIGASVHNGHPLLIFPKLGCNIQEYMARNRCKTPFTYTEAISILYQICVGVSFMHSLRVVITDLKPENICLLLNDDPTALKIRLIDFGSAVLQNESGAKHRHLIQTRHYRAPEVICKLEWSFSCDVWSIGCILTELICGRMLFDTHESIDHLNQIVKCIGAPPSELLEEIEDETWDQYFDERCGLRLDKAKISPVQCQKLDTYFTDTNTDNNCAQLYDLCSQMLRWNPRERITAEQALQHKVFRNIRL